MVLTAGPRNGCARAAFGKSPDQITREEGRIGGHREHRIEMSRRCKLQAGLQPCQRRAMPLLRSGMTARPNPSKRAGSPLALMTTSSVWDAIRAITCASKVWPPRIAKAFSRPMRDDRPPAMTAPQSSCVRIEPLRRHPDRDGIARRGSRLRPRPSRPRPRLCMAALTKPIVCFGMMLFDDVCRIAAGRFSISTTIMAPRRKLQPRRRRQEREIGNARDHQIGADPFRLHVRDTHAARRPRPAPPSRGSTAGANSSPSVPRLYCFTMRLSDFRVRPP